MIGMMGMRTKEGKGKRRKGRDRDYCMGFGLYRRWRRDVMDMKLSPLGKCLSREAVSLFCRWAETWRRLGRDPRGLNLIRKDFAFPEHNLIKGVPFFFPFLSTTDFLRWIRLIGFLFCFFPPVSLGPTCVGAGEVHSLDVLYGRHLFSRRPVGTSRVPAKMQEGEALRNSRGTAYGVWIRPPHTLSLRTAGPDQMADRTHLLLWHLR